MKPTTFSACFALSIFAIATPASASEDGFSVSAIGGYVFGDAPIGHRLFSPSFFSGGTDSGSDAGGYGALDIRYGWDNQFIGFNYQYIGVDRGRIMITPSDKVGMDIQGRIFDLEYGRGFALANGTANWSLGLRRATFDFEADINSPGSGPTHAFKGTGIRAGVETDIPIQGNGLSWFTDTGISILSGEIETTARAPWLCTQCVNTSTTAVGLDAKIGLNYKTSDRATWKFGYQVQYWNGVNVEYTATNIFSLNQGTSDLLVHGPFVGVNLNF